MKRLLLILALLVTSSVWAAQQVSLSGKYALSGQSSTNAGAPIVYLQDGWETNNWSGTTGGVTNWGYLQGSPAPSTTGSPVYTGSYAGWLHFDSTNPACDGQVTCSLDAWGVKYFDSAHGFPDPVNHLFVRTRFRWHHTTYPASGLAKKLYYIQPQNANDWRIALTVDPDTRKLYINSGPNNCNGTGFSYEGGPALNADTWYSVKFELQLNGVGTDVFRVWVDGSLILDPSSLDLRGTCQSTPLYGIRVGEQTTRFNSEVFNEDRYLDDAVMQSTDPGD
jgi:hypothetical protein